MLRQLGILVRLSYRLRLQEGWCVIDEERNWRRDDDKKTLFLVEFSKPQIWYMIEWKRLQEKRQENWSQMFNKIDIGEEQSTGTAKAKHTIIYALWIREALAEDSRTQRQASIIPVDNVIFGFQHLLFAQICSTTVVMVVQLGLSDSYCNIDSYED